MEITNIISIEQKQKIDKQIETIGREELLKKVIHAIETCVFAEENQKPDAFDMVFANNQQYYQCAIRTIDRILDGTLDEMTKCIIEYIGQDTYKNIVEKIYGY